MGNGSASSNADSEHPIPVPGLSGAAAITAGGQVSAVVLKNGGVEAWPAFGGPSAATVPLLTKIKAVAAGFSSFVTLRDNGTVVTCSPRPPGSPPR